MTIEKLMSELQKLPKETIVKIFWEYSSSNYGWFPVDHLVTIKEGTFLYPKNQEEKK